MDFSVIIELLFSTMLYDSYSIKRDILGLELVVVEVTDDENIDLLESVISVSPLFFGQHLSLCSHPDATYLLNL